MRSLILLSLSTLFYTGCSIDPKVGQCYESETSFIKVIENLEYGFYYEEFDRFYFEATKKYTTYRSFVELNIARIDCSAYERITEGHK